MDKTAPKKPATPALKPLSETELEQVSGGKIIVEPGALPGEYNPYTGQVTPPNG